jgi:tRNA(Arg) A34 adenosine deaminase TadA
MSKKRFNITAIIYDKRGRVLSIGKNSYTKTHPVQAAYSEKAGLPHKIYLHAEIHAIVKCKNLEKAHRIVVFRYDNEGNPRSAKPCPICESAIKETSIKVIEHT